MQRLNTWFNGTLNQHILAHHQGDKREETKQEIQFPGNDERWYVNTMHHQSVDILGDNLEILCYSQRYFSCYSSERNIQEWKEYNKEGQIIERYEVPIIIEGFRHNTLKIIGLQFHPEETNCPYSRELIQNLLKDE